MSEDERSYFQARAEQEIRAAQCAGHPDAARAHYRLAGYYLDLAHNPGAVAPLQPAIRRHAGYEAARANAMPTSSARRGLSPGTVRLDSRVEVRA